MIGIGNEEKDFKKIHTDLGCYRSEMEKCFSHQGNISVSASLRKKHSSSTALYVMLWNCCCLPGTVTEETLNLMKQDRCGVPDITPEQRIPFQRRTKRYALHGEEHRFLCGSNRSFHVNFGGKVKR